MIVTKFDFKKVWHLVEPHLDDPQVLESLDEGMLRSSQYYNMEPFAAMGQEKWYRAMGIYES